MLEDVVAQDVADTADATAPAAKEREVFLDPGSLFFSRTNDRGLIQAGNRTFQTISVYKWAELLGAPHKIVRHPDMPKAVFHVLWDGLQTLDTPIVAYVKKKTKDGNYYWVLAFASRMDGGYISVRIKPQSDLLTKIKGEYSALRARELSEKLSAQDSAAILISRLAEHGFADYSEFAAAAAAQELLCLGQTQAWVNNRKIQKLVQINEALKDVRARCQGVAEACDAIELLPTNLEIQSARLGRRAAPIAIIARDSKERTRTLRQKMTNFVAEMGTASKSVNAAIIEVCVSQVQDEMLRSFSAESVGDSNPDEPEFEREVSALADSRSKNDKNQWLQLKDALAQITSCSASLATITREVTGINVTRTMCSIENSSLDQTGGTIQMIIEELNRFQTTIPQALRSIKGLFDIMERDLNGILER